MSAISGVPAADVGKVVQDFIDDGATRVVVEQGDDGSFTVMSV